MNSHSLTASELVAIVHRFYPVNLEGDDPRHANSEEFQRLVAAREHALGNVRPWELFSQRVREAIPGCFVQNWSTLRYDACWRCRVHLPGTGIWRTSAEVKSVVGLVSILAPVFAIYASHQINEEQRVVRTQISFPPLPTEFQPHETVLDALIRTSFGFERLSNDILFTPVKDIQAVSKTVGKVQLIDCLFTDDIQ